jgi:photosystem II stability/assembly factor-like uncharacterized protein
MKEKLYIATNHGVFVGEKDNDGWKVVAGGLVEQKATSIIAREGVVLAGTRNGVYRSTDDGRTWAAGSVGLTEPYVRWMAFHPDVSDLEFAGTEPADIFVSHDGGDNWRECPEVAALRDLHRWSLPYSPRAGCIRGFAFHGSRGYAAVEVGGVLCSDDRGDTWRLAEGSNGDPDLDGPPEPLIYPDVHSINVHPSSADIVFAPTGGGFYRSSDGGKTWTLLYDCYCRACWLDPRDANHIILGPADGVSENGRIEETRDGGKTWQNASAGTSAPWADHMVERFSQVGDDLVAVLSNGEVLAAPVATLQWRRVLADLTGVACVTAMRR